MSEDMNKEFERRQQVLRDSKGRFLNGGNPKGRPKGSKNKIVAMKQDLELALRENINGNDVMRIISAMVDEAQNGNVSAAKLILDKVMSNAKVDEDVSAENGGITISIKNLTVGDATEAIEGEVINREEDT